MQHVKFATLMIASCLLVGATASAEPTTTTTPKKHKQCEGSKVKTACNNQLDVKEFVQGLQAPPPTTDPTVGADQTANAQKAVQPAKDDSAQPQTPQ